jgi:hypothetical protein
MPQPLNTRDIPVLPSQRCQYLQHQAFTGDEEHVMGAARGLAAGTAFVAVAVGLAFHAAAEPPVGRYTATVIDEASGQELPGQTTILVFNPCGSGCTRVLSPTGTFDLHLQDSAWSGDAQSADGQTCTHTVNARLVWTHSCTGPAIRAQLTKSG